MYFLKVTYWDPDPSFRWYKDKMGRLVYIFSSRVFATLTAQSGACLCPVLKAVVNIPCSPNAPKMT